MFAVFYVSGERVKGLRGSLYVGVLPFMYIFLKQRSQGEDKTR